MMKHSFSLIGVALMLMVCGCSANDRTAREERKTIKAGNILYESGQYGEAAEKYKEAIEINPNSMEALFNLSLASLKRAGTVDSDSLKNSLMSQAVQGFSAVSQSSDADPQLAGKAAYNLGNLDFENKQFQGAIAKYKQALRYNPADNDARRNLRIAQLQQNDDQNNNDNQDQQDQEQEQQNQDEQQQNQNQDQNQEQNQEQQQPQINNQSAEQILQSIENRENQVRARMMKGNEASQSQSRNRKW